MLNKVEVRTNQGALLTFLLEDISNGFVVEDIGGLDPVRAALVSSSFAQLDGEQYQSSRREKRNLTFRIKYEPDYTSQSVRGLRNQLYGFFMPKAEVHFRFFMEDMPPVDISGTVEDFDSPLFAKEPRANISILCYNPDFEDTNPVLESGFTTSGVTETEFVYSGSVETGIKLRLNINRTLPEFTVYHRPADGSLSSLEFVAPLVAGDVLEISTIPGSKYATLTRAGAGSSILYGISPQSNWIEFFPGTNNLRVYAEGAAIPYTIEYTTKYGGL